MRRATILAQDAEDGADGAADIEVRGAIQRIEQHAVLAFGGVVAAQDHRLFILLRGHDGDAFAAAERAQQDVVGDHIELLLLFALHVLVADRAEHIIQPRAAHMRCNHLGGDRQRRQDPGKLAAGLGIARLLLQDVSLQRDDLGGAGGRIGGRIDHGGHAARALCNIGW